MEELLEKTEEQETLQEEMQEQETNQLPMPDITRRLAAEFLQLQKEFPSLENPEQLPEGVLDMAAEENIPLLDALLRFRWQEEKRRLAEEERRARTAQQSAGSLADKAAPRNPEQDTFVRAFRQALR